MKRCLREPLLHFVLLGAAFFALNAWRTGGKPAEPEAARIEVSAKTITWLREGFDRQWHRAPDADELRGLVQDHIREELLYREAQALGLDRDDTIVRRRMAQKMDFLTQDIAATAAPDESQLRAFFAANAARYVTPGRVTFRHVYFSSQKRGADAAAAAREALVALGNGADDQTMGDPFLQGFTFAEQEQDDVIATFGGGFANQIAQQPAGGWHGPVESSYGQHLVLVDARKASQPVPFESVREAVDRDLVEERRHLANGNFIARLQERYQITVDEAALAMAATAATKTVER